MPPPCHRPLRTTPAGGREGQCQLPANNSTAAAAGMAHSVRSAMAQKSRRESRRAGGPRRRFTDSFFFFYHHHSANSKFHPVAVAVQLELRKKTTMPSTPDPNTTKQTSFSLSFFFLGGGGHRREGGPRPIIRKTAHGAGQIPHSLVSENAHISGHGSNQNAVGPKIPTTSTKRRKREGGLHWHFGHHHHQKRGGGG